MEVIRPGRIQRRGAAREVGSGRFRSVEVV